jgi:phosphohistidine phosphatase
MRRLLLLRHAKAERPQAGGRDHERLLDARGRDDAGTVGHYLLRHTLIPELVLVSTAARTRQTWELAAAALDKTPSVVLEDRLYNAGAEDILKVLKEIDPGVRTILLVGHNPGLHELAASLVASGDLESRQRLHEEFPTAALAVIDFPLDAWEKLHPHSGRLEQFVSARSLAAATD